MQDPRNDSCPVTCSRSDVPYVGRGRMVIGGQVARHLRLLSAPTPTVTISAFRYPGSVFATIDTVAERLRERARPRAEVGTASTEAPVAPTEPVRSADRERPNQT